VDVYGFAELAGSFPSNRLLHIGGNRFA